MIEFRGVPVCEVNGLPYSIYQAGQSEWRMVIQNCARYPAGYVFPGLYESYDEALTALAGSGGSKTASAAGDDTGASYLLSTDSASTEL